MAGTARRAFIPIAGLHHAAREHAAGFCVFNDCGVAIEMLRRKHGLKRIAYVDIDAHHGDGVFYAFEDDPDLMFADIHEDGRYLYPGTGSADETGARRRAPAPSSTSRCRRARTTRSSSRPGRGSRPICAAHEPEFILLQCGADSLERRPDHAPALHRGSARARGRARCARIADELGHGRVLGMGGGGYNRRNLARAWTASSRRFVDSAALSQR